jgi:hypothetical protein
VLDVPLTGCSLDTAGGYELATLPNPVYHGNTFIDGVLLSTGKYASKSSFDERKAEANAGIVPSSSNPKWWITGSKVYVSPFTAGDLVTIFYKRQPADMVFSDDADLLVNCEFAGDIVDIIVEYAAYWGLKFIIQNEKTAAAALDAARNDIAVINGGPAPTDSTTEIPSVIYESPDRFVVNINYDEL